MPQPQPASLGGRGPGNEQIEFNYWEGGLDKGGIVMPVI